MRLIRVFAPLVLLLAAAPAFARGDEERDAEIRACIVHLESKDDADRAKAAARLVEMGWIAVDRAARGSASFDDKAWSAFADAIASDKRNRYALPLRAAARTAPEAHRARLLDLAKRIDPEGGKVRTPQEIEAVCREYLIDRRGERCSSGHDEAVAALGHDAVPLVISMIRDAKSLGVDVNVACWALAIMADADDVPALRELLLAGTTAVAKPLAVLQERGVAPATDALLAAVAAGRFDDDIARALEGAPDRAGTAKALRGWFAKAPPEALTADARGPAAGLFAQLGARDAAPLLESWIAMARKDWEFTGLADALTALGSREGLALSLRIATERRTRFPCMNPATDSDVADDVAKGLLPCNGFHPINRWEAARRLGEIAAGAVKVPTDDEWSAARRADREAHREPPNEADALDAIAADLRKWWDGAKDKVTFDPASGRWSVGK